MVWMPGISHLGSSSSLPSGFSSMRQVIQILSADIYLILPSILIAPVSCSWNCTCHSLPQARTSSTCVYLSLRSILSTGATSYPGSHLQCSLVAFCMQLTHNVCGVEILGTGFRWSPCQRTEQPGKSRGIIVRVRRTCREGNKSEHQGVINISSTYCLLC